MFKHTQKGLTCWCMTSFQFFTFWGHDKDYEYVTQQLKSKFPAGKTFVLVSRQNKRFKSSVCRAS